MTTYESMPLNIAYRILEVTPQSSHDEIRSQFKVLILQTHPDKGGDPEEFMLVKRAFATVLAARRVDLERNSVQESVVRMRQERDTVSCVRMEEFDCRLGKFNTDQFNRVFEELYTPSREQQGHDEFMRSDQRVKKQVIVYEEPMQLVASKSRFCELGHDGSNFTIHNAMDLRDAYSDPNEEELGKFEEDVEDADRRFHKLKSLREQNIAMTPEDQRRFDRIRDWQEQREIERQQRVLEEEQRLRELNSRMQFRIKGR
jgi:hypothetical protein